MAYLNKYVMFIFVLYNIPFVFSIKCWDCQSSYDPMCADPFDNTTLAITDCSQEKGLSHLPGIKPTVCRKIRQKVNGLLVVSRGCAWKRQDDFTSACPSSSNGPNEVTYFCETCDYDGCNGAATIGKTIALLLAPLGLLLFK